MGSTPLGEKGLGQGERQLEWQCSLHSSRADDPSEPKLRQERYWVFINRALDAAPPERVPDLGQGISVKLLTIAWKELHSELSTANPSGN